MGKKIRIFLASAVIVVMIVWAFTSVRTRTYNGANIAFEVGNGSVLVTNQGREAIPVEMRAVGSRSTFRIESRELGLREVSKRQKIGTRVNQAVKFELPPGQARIDVTRGDKVLFISGSDQSILATVKPMNQSSITKTWFYTAVVVLGALFYISRLLNHSWVEKLRGSGDNQPRLKRRLT